MTSAIMTIIRTNNSLESGITKYGIWFDIFSQDHFYHKIEEKSSESDLWDGEEEGGGVY